MDCLRGFSDWLAHFAAWWGRTIDFPAFILLVIFVLGIYVLYKTQTAENDFDFSHMLKDENGKPSASRLAMFVCLAITSWGLMYVIITRKGEIDAWLFLGYTAIWSGTKVAETAMIAYANRGKPPAMNGQISAYGGYPGQQPTGYSGRRAMNTYGARLPDDDEFVGNMRVNSANRRASGQDDESAPSS